MRSEPPAAASREPQGGRRAVPGPLLVLALACACRPASGPGSDSLADTSSGQAAAPAPRPGSATEVLFLGDSLSAGQGLPRDEAFPSVVGRLLRERGHPVRVINAGVSGDTTGGGLRRLSWVLRSRPDVVVVELGANDGLRGLPADLVEANLRAIIERSREAGASVLLAGMTLPGNYGGDHVSAFTAVFPRVAEDLDVPLVPFLLEGVAGRPELNLADGMHPNAEGHRRIAEGLLPYLEPLVRRSGVEAADP